MSERQLAEHENDPIFAPSVSLINVCEAAIATARRALKMSTGQLYSDSHQTDGSTDEELSFLTDAFQEAWVNLAAKYFDDPHSPDYVRNDLLLALGFVFGVGVAKLPLWPSPETTSGKLRAIVDRLSVIADDVRL